MLHDFWPWLPGSKLYYTAVCLKTKYKLPDLLPLPDVLDRLLSSLK